MHIFIVCGDGAPGPDQNLQAVEFWNHAATLANWCIAGAFSPVLYRPKRVSEYIQAGQSQRGPQEELAKQEPCSTVSFETVQTIKSAIASVTDGVKVLFVLAHGVANPAGGGTVALTVTGTDRNLKSDDVLAMQAVVYIGLHCHAGNFVATLNKTLAFHLTGTDVGQNTDICNFVAATNKKTLLAFLNYLGSADYMEDPREKKEALGLAKKEIEKLAASTNQANNKPGSAGVVGQW